MTFLRTTMATTALVLAASRAPAAEKPNPPAAAPDLTQPGAIDKVDRRGTHDLGATGMRGWIYTHVASNHGARQGRTTVAARQILVTHVGENSPADGVMKMNDVILDANGDAFTCDARRSLALAIQEAEETESDGVLTLDIWRRDAVPAKPDASQRGDLDSLPELPPEGDVQDAGKVLRELEPVPEQEAASPEQTLSGARLTVSLRLAILGAYSATAPSDCPKSRRILDAACEGLAKETPEKNIWKAVNGLALLASGRPEHMPLVCEWAHEIGPPTLDIRQALGMVTWHRALSNLFLCEYYLLTGDKHVWPAIEAYTIDLAKGESMWGTFGHGYALQPVNGGFPGAVPPYGALNQAGLMANIAMVLGRKWGVHNPELDAAIERASRFFGDYVGKGGIPYGEHVPYMCHGANGKNASAAVFVGLPDRSRPRGALLLEDRRRFLQELSARPYRKPVRSLGLGYSTPGSRG